MSAPHACATLNSSKVVSKEKKEEEEEEEEEEDEEEEKEEEEETKQVPTHGPLITTLAPYSSPALAKLHSWLLTSDPTSKQILNEAQSSIPSLPLPCPTPSYVK